MATASPAQVLSKAYRASVLADLRLREIIRWPAVLARLLPLLWVTACAHVPSAQLWQDTGYRDLALNPQAIGLISWNIQKNAAKNRPRVLARSGLGARLATADLLLFQEACVSAAGDASGLTAFLTDQGYGWAFAVAFESASLGCGQRIATGVLTASRASPLSTIALRSRHREFGVTPKTALATIFALRAQRSRLLVVNAHLLNFEWLNLDDFTAQLQRIGQLIGAHRGPVILAGDLNTRNAQRQDRVDRLADRYGLRSVFGDKPGARTQALFGGGYALDHIYYRGLRLVQPGRVGQQTGHGYSDHNSLAVTFALPDTP